MPKIIKIQQHELVDLYIIKKLSSYQIAKALSCSQSLIIKKLKLYEIPTRTIQEGKALTKPIYERRDFSGNLCEKAYMIGFRLGDLYVRKTHPKSPTLQIRTNSTRPEQLILFKRIFSKYAEIRTSRPDRRGAILMRCYLNSTFSFLWPKQDDVEPWIKKGVEYFLAFLAGYTDAEGMFCIRGGDGVFSIRSQDRNILNFLRLELKKLGVLSQPLSLARPKGSKDKQGVRSNKDVWAFTVYRKQSLLKLVSLLKPLLKHPKRMKDMYKIERNIIERNQKYNNKADAYWYKTYSHHERALEMASNSS